MSKKSKHTKTAALRKATQTGKSNKHITKISATSNRSEGSHKKPADKAEVTQIVHAKSQKSPKSTKKPVENTSKPAPKAKKSANPGEKPLAEVFVLARPFVTLGRYIRDSWREIRQVRWPNRKTTWKMTLAVLVYCAIFMVFILLLDTLFTFVFSLLIK